MIPEDLKTKLLQLSRLELYRILLYACFRWLVYQVGFLLRCAVYRFRHWLKYPRPRAFVHWAGAANRPRRLERVFVAFVLVGGFFALETQQLLLWATAWGSLASAFVIWQSIRMLSPRRQYQYHWVNK